LWYVRVVVLSREGGKEFAVRLENGFSGVASGARLSVMSRMASAGLALSVSAAALAGGVGENAVLLIDPSDPVSMRVGNHYKAARLIPDANVIYYRSDATGYIDFANRVAPTFLAALAQRGLDDHVDFVVLAPTAGYRIPASGLFTDNCSPVNFVSVASAYVTTYIRSELLAGNVSSLLTNQYFSGSGTPGFSSRLSYLAGASSTSSSARRYFIGAMLGYTAGTGNNTPEEIIAMIDRSVATDGTRPAGTFYYCNNPADPARNVRAAGYTFPSNGINSLGGSSQIVNNTVLPSPNQNCIGIMTGNATLGDLSTIGIRPGAFCDHLTSFAAVFENTGQSRVCEWIRAGASGSAGMVDEPCNYLAKFPTPNIHMFYFQGLTLGEAYFRTVQAVPFQGLFYGDPLTRAYSWVPTVNVANLPTGAVSGTISFNATGSSPRSGGGVNQYELYVDGRLIRRQATGAFTLDTTTLSDGMHDVRVLGRENGTPQTMGRWSGPLQTDNFGKSVTVGVSPTSTGDLGTTFTFTCEASGGGVVALHLTQNGRVIAGARASSATFSIVGNTLGASASTLRAEAIFNDGRRAISGPVTVTVAPTGGVSVLPRTFGYTKFATPGVSTIVELPATFGESVASATYGVGALTQAMLAGASDLSYRVVTPSASATGSERLSFQVTTASGVSNTSYVTLVYTGLPPCVADVDDGTASGTPDGGVTIDDLLYYLGLFEAGDVRADVDDGTGGGVPDGGVTIDDLLYYLVRFEGGC
jgi:hypothetical protein